MSVPSEADRWRPEFRREAAAGRRLLARVRFDRASSAGRRVAG